MTIEGIKDSIKAIREKMRKTGDFESCYSDEIRLYQEVLAAIAKGKVDSPSDAAKEVLKVKRLKYTRCTA